MSFTRLISSPMIIEGGRQIKCPLLLCTTADRVQATNVADSAVICFMPNAGYTRALRVCFNKRLSQATTHILTLP